MNTKPQKALIYCRVASYTQGDDSKINAQIQSCENYAAQHHYAVQDIFTDKGVPALGQAYDNNGLQTMLNLLTSEEDHYTVIVQDAARLSRDFKCYQHITAMMKESGHHLEIVDTA